MRSTLPLYILLLCLLPLQPSAAPGAGPTYFTKPENNAQTSPVASTSTSNSSGPNCTDLSSSTGATHPSCWDTLGMFEWMFNWSLSNKTCEQGEIWSTCFLRLAYGGARYECATLGSENCTAPELGGPVTDPRVFYGAFNIYGKHATKDIHTHPCTQHHHTDGHRLIHPSLLSRQPILQHLVNSPLRPKIPISHHLTRRHPRRGRNPRPAPPNPLLPPRSRSLQIRSRQRRRRNPRVDPALRQRCGESRHERDVLFDAAGDAAGTGAAELDGGNEHAVVSVSGAGGRDDGLYGGESAAVGGDFGGGVGGECE